MSVDQSVDPLRHGAYSNHHLSNEVSFRIASFTPNAPKSLWSEDVQRFTRSAVSDFAPVNEDEAARYISAVAWLTMWSVEPGGLPLDRTIIFSAANRRRFLAHGHSSRGAASKAGFSYLLERIAADLLTFDPARPGVRVPKAAEPFAPYSSAEIARFRSQTMTRSTALQRARWRALLTLGAGLALSVGEIMLAQVSDVEDNGDHLVMHVGGGKRSVICLAAWETEFRALLDDPEVDTFLYPKVVRPKKPSFQAKQFIAIAANPGEGFQIERLRSTWIVDHVNAGTPLVPLMEALGVKSLSTLERLASYFAQPSDDELITAFRLAADE